MMMIFFPTTLTNPQETIFPVEIPIRFMHDLKGVNTTENNLVKFQAFVP
jgi:hypothetical protein